MRRARLPIYARAQERSDDAVIVWDGPDGGAWLAAVVSDGPQGTEEREVRVLLSEKTLSILSRRAQVAALNVKRKEAAK